MTPTTKQLLLVSAISIALVAIGGCRSTQRQARAPEADPRYQWADPSYGLQSADSLEAQMAAQDGSLQPQDAALPILDPLAAQSEFERTPRVEPIRNLTRVEVVDTPRRTASKQTATPRPDYDLNLRAKRPLAAQQMAESELRLDPSIAWAAGGMESMPDRLNVPARRDVADQPLPANEPKQLLTKVDPVYREPATPATDTETISLPADVLFPYGRFEEEHLAPSGRHKLEELAQQLKQLDPAAVQAIEVVGHADRLGPKQANQRLSERRARTIKNYLVKLGVDPSVIKSVGRGSSDPMVHCAGSKKSKKLVSCLALNRRVEVVVHARAGSMDTNITRR